MAADVTPRLHEIKTGFCNMLVKGNLPGWKPLQPLLYNRKTTHHLLRHALLSFFHPETHSPAILCPTSSASDWIHQTISANFLYFTPKEQIEGKTRETVWRLKRCPDCVNTPNVTLTPRWNIHSLPSEKTNHWFYGSWCWVALVRLGLASCLLNVKLHSHRQTGQQMIYEKCDSTKSQRGLHLTLDGWK